MKAFALLLLPAAACAQTRTSATYAITAETAGRGGGRSTAGNLYTNDGSAGTITGISTVAAPAETVRHGFAGQLTDAVSLELAANVPTIPEVTGTFQMTPFFLNDDGTISAVAASSVAWSIRNGPLAGVTNAGLVTAGATYTTISGEVQGIYAGLTGFLLAIVTDSVPDNYGPFAGDGLPDDWQQQYFAASPVLAGPLLDPDGDGQNNRFEFIAGLVPTSATSRFQFDIQSMPHQPGQKLLVFSPRLSDRTYVVQSAPNPSSGQWGMLLNFTASDAGTVRTVTDLNATGAHKSYRVQIFKP